MRPPFSNWDRAGIHQHLQGNKVIHRLQNFPTCRQKGVQHGPTIHYPHNRLGQWSSSLPLQDLQDLQEAKPWRAPRPSWHVAMPRHRIWPVQGPPPSLRNCSAAVNGWGFETKEPISGPSFRRQSWTSQSVMGQGTGTTWRSERKLDPLAVFFYPFITNCRNFGEISSNIFNWILLNIS